MLGRLEQQLGEQLKMCLDTGEHHKAMGDVSGANRFQHLALAVKQDIDVVKMAKRFLLYLHSMITLQRFLIHLTVVFSPSLLCICIGLIFYYLFPD